MCRSGSGTLLSARIYVMAGHCTGFHPDPDVTTSPASAQVFFGLGPFPRGNWGGPGTSCTGKTGYPCVATVAGIPIPHPHARRRCRPTRGAGARDAVRAARAGRVSRPFDSPNAEISIVQSYVGATQLQDLRSAIAGGYEVRMTDSRGNGTGGGGTCFGDSGGSVFPHGAPPACSTSSPTSRRARSTATETSAGYRLDQESARSFLGHFVALL